MSPPEADITSSLGRQVTLAAARQAVDFPVVLPAPFGRPEGVHLRGEGSRALVTLAYGARPGLPLDEETTFSALLTQLRGRPTENLIKKVTPVTSVTEVIGERGARLLRGGTPGGVRPGPGDRPVADAPRVAGNTLLWTRGPVTLHLEVDLPLDRALEVARGEARRRGGWSGG